MPSPFPVVMVKEILCGGPGRTHTGTDNPNASLVEGSKYDIYIQSDPSGQVYIWINTNGTSTGWV